MKTALKRSGTVFDGATIASASSSRLSRRVTPVRSGPKMRSAAVPRPPWHDAQRAAS
jgi:hypothetical protein